MEKNESKRYTGTVQRSLLRRQGSSMIFSGTSGTLPFNFYPLQHSTRLRKATTLERLISMRSLPFSSCLLAINHHRSIPLTTMITMTIDEYTSYRCSILDELAWKLTSWKVNKMGIKFRILGPQPEATVSLTPLSASSAFLLPFPSSNLSDLPQNNREKDTRYIDLLLQLSSSSWSSFSSFLFFFPTKVFLCKRKIYLSLTFGFYVRIDTRIIIFGFCCLLQDNRNSLR